MMNEDNLDACVPLVTKSYVDLAKGNFRHFHKRFHHVLEQRKLPEEGFSDLEIEGLLHEISMMDSNNFTHAVGAGEREGRVVSTIVQRRHFWMSHGVGRSGDISALQPKAAGSSLVSQLANALTLDVLKMNGVPTCQAAFIVPMATGMTLTLCFLTLRAQRPEASNVIWPRIDQKSCLKSIYTAGFKALVVEPMPVGDELQTDMDEVERLIESHGSEKILCVMATTSCFAPRVPDNLVKLSRLCARTGVPLVVNNAYGVMLPRCMNLIQEAHKQGRVDLFVQSTDKNFLVPVGGAVVAGFKEDLVKAVSLAYPGRGSGTPSLDMFITLLSLGRRGVRELQRQREQCFQELRQRITNLAQGLGERVLDTPHNPVSLAMTLTKMHILEEDGDSKTEARDCDVTQIGSRLFTRGCTGARVVLCASRSPSRVTKIHGHEFTGYGSHSSSSAVDYINVAAAVGQNLHEVQRVADLLAKVLGSKS